MKMPMSDSITSALRDARDRGYAHFTSNSDINQTTRIILNRLSALETSRPEIVETSGVGLSIDPYAVVASMAQAASQMDAQNESGMANRDINDTNLTDATRRLGWGLQAIFGVHALVKKEREGVPLEVFQWRVSGLPQSIDSWYVLYNTLRVNLEPRIADMGDEAREQFYQAFTKHIRDNTSVSRMIRSNRDLREDAKQASREWIQSVESIRYKRITDDIDEQARIASTELNPFGL